MRYGRIEHFQTGISVPVFSVRGPHSCGIGEFADLSLFGNWARDCGFDLLQILPVQDTGIDPSPYGALSAFALHPIYVRLQELEGVKPYLPEIEAARRHFDEGPQCARSEILDFKLSILQRIHARHDPRQLLQELEPWIEQNEWVRDYAAFHFLKDRQNGRPWTQWPRLQDPLAEDIDQLWDEHRAPILLYVWIQKQLADQLESASAELARIGVRLKGDLPILLNEDSADVWRYRELFDRGGRAGAPPDMYAEYGQNWGFPCYRWGVHTQTGYRWWKARLAQASRFYHAIRIDHVLGFFRIWRIPITSQTGMLGSFDPSLPIERSELRARGFPDERIDTLAAIGGEIGNTPPTETDLRDSITGEERQLEEYRRLWNRVLLDVDGDNERFRPFWFWHQSPLFASLPQEEQSTLRELFLEDEKRQEGLWADVGRQRLRVIRDASDVLVCAEDLGTVPRCVPEVLEELDVLGLRVERWTRHWSEPGQPFLDPSSYPRATVCSPSVHDSSTLRAWWEEREADRVAYWQALGRDGEPPHELDPQLCAQILDRNLASNSLLCVLALQDCLALFDDLRVADPREERINVPGSRRSANWNYRMPLSLEALRAHEPLRKQLRSMISRRRNRSLD